MATKKTAAADNHDVVVLFRSGYGMDWNELYHVNKGGGAKGQTLDAAKADAIAKIKDHRAGGQGYEYRIKDMVSGAILD